MILPLSRKRKPAQGVGIREGGVIAKKDRESVLRCSGRGPGGHAKEHLSAHEPVPRVIQLEFDWELQTGKRCEVNAGESSVGSGVPVCRASDPESERFEYRLGSRCVMPSESVLSLRTPHSPAVVHPIAFTACLRCTLCIPVGHTIPRWTEGTWARHTPATFHPLVDPAHHRHTTGPRPEGPFSSSPHSSAHRQDHSPQHHSTAAHMHVLMAWTQGFRISASILLRHIVLPLPASAWGMGSRCTAPSEAVKPCYPAPQATRTTQELGQMLKNGLVSLRSACPKGALVSQRLEVVIAAYPCHSWGGGGVFT
eukprot:Sspe_Gene.107072::Locus_85142_Transcript_2_3_Confidence_0.500_Length_1203::g.107072::m.107072